MRIVFDVCITGLLALIPILGWAYLFSYLDNSQLNGKRFLIGIVAGGISVIPILHLEQFVSALSSEYLNIFSAIIASERDPMRVLLSLDASILAIGIFMLVSLLIFVDAYGKTMKAYLTSMVSLGVFSGVFLLLFLIIRATPSLGDTLKDIHLGSGVNTLGGVILYYVIIGLLEEGSKHFAFIPSSLTASDTLRKGVIYATFISLGFGFIENILYVVNEIQTNGYTGTVFSMLFFRSIFSLLVHLLCGLLLADIFLKGYLEFRRKGVTWVGSLLLILKAFILSILVHAVYDISLTLGFSLIVFIYFIGSYLYITRLFYKENSG